LQANNCEFGALRDELIRDRLVVGIRSDSVRSRLLREAELTLHKAIDICRAAKVTDSRMACIKSGGENQINALDRESKYAKKSQQKDYKTKRVNKASQQTSKVLCKYCGNKHVRYKNKCPAYGKSCKECGKKNNFAKVCMNKNKAVHDTECGELFIGTLADVNTVTASNDEWHTTLEIEGKIVKLKLDTGAKCNILPKTVYNLLKLHNKITPTNTKLIAYSGDTIEVLGEVFVYKSKSYRLGFYVVDRPTQTILGLKDCELLNLIQRLEELENNCKTENDFLKKYSDVFTSSEIGSLPGLHHIEIDKNAKPVIHSPRRVPATLRPRIKAELDQMECIGVQNGCLLWYQL
jgi:hypothetical protein